MSSGQLVTKLFKLSKKNLQKEIVIAVAAGKDFLRNFNDPTRNIHNILDSDHKSKMQENVESLHTLWQTKYCVAGHGVDGNPKLPPTHSEGNFRVLLRFGVDAGDLKLDNHLKISLVQPEAVIKHFSNISAKNRPDIFF